MAVALISSCATKELPKAVTNVASHSAPVVKDLAMVGEWGIAIEPTADVLARAQFGTKQTFTVKAGATTPVTDVVTTPFNQKKYEEAKAIWIEGLNKPELQQWRIILKANHKGQQIETQTSGEIKTNQIKWEMEAGNVLHLEYPAEKRRTTYHCRVVSSNEWHYPMEPLGGWFVMRRW